MPHADRHHNLGEYLDDVRLPGGFFGHADEYTVSLLKAYFGDAATGDNDFCFEHLPRLTGDHSIFPAVMGMLDGWCKGFFLPGENPVVGSPNGRLHRRAMAKLDWLVVRDLVLTESATFWQNGPRSRAAGYARRRSPPRCSSCPPPPTPRRTAPSPTPSGCCSDTAGPSSHPATAAPTCGSTTTWAGSSATGWPPRPIPRTSRSRTWPGTTRWRARSPSPAPRR
jgi:hypothetical protein